MITRIEIDGFKTFENFSLDLSPMTAIVGPNASGKSNLFDALRFLSLLAQSDIRTAMQGLRGEPEELFRQARGTVSDSMKFAVEVLLDQHGIDTFGTKYDIPAQRLRYELLLWLVKNNDGTPSGIEVKREDCRPIAKRDEKASYLKTRKLSRNSLVSPFIRLSDTGDAIEVRQDGRQKHGRPMRLSLRGASRTALSAITTAEFPHLYALRQALTDVRFLEINPRAARSVNDRFEDRVLRSDASNLSAVLAHLKERTQTRLRPEGALADVAADLAVLIPSVRKIIIRNDTEQHRYSFGLLFDANQTFSSRVISDGTLRLLALLTILNDPAKRGTLCFEEPENGVHEGRVPMLVSFLRDATALLADNDARSFQILLNTHSPRVMEALQDGEIVAADSVVTLDPTTTQRSTRTRMRTGVMSAPDMFDAEKCLTRTEIETLLKRAADAA